MTALLRRDDDEGLPPRFELSAPHGAHESVLTHQPYALKSHDHLKSTRLWDVRPRRVIAHRGFNHFCRHG